MIKWHFNIITIIFSFWSCCIFSQINCTVPESPLLTSVSVQPETGKTDFTWTLSPSTGIAAYILYTYKNGDGLPIDTIWDPTATSYTISTTASKYFSVSYVVTAHRLSAVPGLPGCTSPLSNDLSTIFCTSVIDTCNKKISVKWNKYKDYPKRVKEYKILVSANGGPLVEMYTVASTEDNYTISDFATDSQYCLVVRALLEDGTVSNSNKSCLSTKMQQPPGWINADQASISSDNKISLSFTIDPLSEIRLFRLERKNSQSGTFQEIAQPASDGGIVLFTDNKADINTVNYYRLSAINSCNIPVTVSNISSNIVLSLKKADNDIILSWNSYKEWLGMISSYRLFIDTGNGFEEKESVAGNDTVIILRYKELMYEVSGSEICFYVNASETSNPYGVAGQSLSTRICTEPIELITVPNVFTPDNDLINDYFRPVLSFTPLDYHLIISDRKGIVLFETRDFMAEWDGSNKGNPPQQDVVLWFLRVTTPSGKSISKTGTVTIFHNK